MSKPKKQFCKNGHDTFVVGRTSDGHCFQCVEDRKTRKRKGPKLPQQFCPKGHDTFIVGRYKGHCIQCRKENMEKWQEDNKEHLEEYRTEYYIENRELILRKKKENHERNKVIRKLRDEEYYDTHRDIILEKKRESNRINKDKLSKRAKERRVKNRDSINQKQREIRKANPEKFRIYEAKRNAKRLKNNIKYKLERILRNRFKQALKNNYKKGSAVKDLGCSISFFKDYIESLFYADMSWNNYGIYWELDHIKELHTFDLNDREQVLEVCNYTNLQPLTIEDHLKKTIANFGSHKRN